MFYLKKKKNFCKILICSKRDDDVDVAMKWFVKNIFAQIGNGGAADAKFLRL